jgi:hypothetical protein
MNKEDPFALQIKLLAMPEYALARKLLGLDQSRYIFQQNYADLIRLLQHWSQPEHGLELSSEHNRHKLHAFQVLLSRFLFNYVSSAMALVDHTRNLHRSLNLPARNFPEFEDKEDALGRHPTAAFVKGLRTYSFHFSALPISTQVRSTTTTGITITHGLAKEDLLTHKKWPSAAKTFLADHADPIDLASTLRDYHSLVADFQEWFSDQERIIFAAELVRMEAAQRHYLSRLTQVEVESFLTSSAEEQSLRLPALLMHPIPALDWAELSKFPLQSNERTEKLIGLLRRAVDFDDEFERKIRSCFEAK